jgi:tetratricopeptide (TPR) repeat protein
MQKDGYEDATYWRARNRQAYIGMRINKYKETERISKNVLEFFADAPASGENGIAHNHLSYVYMIRGDYDASIYHAQQPLLYTVREDDPLVWYVSMGNLGYAHYLKGDLKRAREIYEEIDRNLGDGHYSPSGAAYMKNNLGEILREMGEIRQAKELFQQAHENFASIKHMRGMAFTLLNMGGVEYMQGNYAQARTHYQRAYDLNREVGDQWGLAHSLSSLGNLAAAAGDHVLAAQKYDASLNIRREIGDRRGMADSITDLAVCEVNTKRYTHALTLLDEALVIRREIGDRQGEGMALALAGIAGVLHGEQQNSHENLLAAVQIGEELGARNVLTQAYSGLGELELMANRAQAAETWFKRALSLYSRDEGDLAMTLWALTGIARIRLAQGQDIAALQLVALVLRYPRTYIAIIETLVGTMLDDLTTRLQPQKVEQTMNFSKTLEMSQVISDLLSEA